MIDTLEIALLDPPFFTDGETMVDILEITLLSPPFFTDGKPTVEPTVEPIVRIRHVSVSGDILPAEAVQKYSWSVEILKYVSEDGLGTIIYVDGAWVLEYELEGSKTWILTKEDDIDPTGEYEAVALSGAIGTAIVSVYVRPPRPVEGEVNRFDAPGRFGSSGTFRFGVDSPNGRFNISGTFRFE